MTDAPHIEPQENAYNKVALGEGRHLLTMMQRDRDTLGAYPEQALHVPSKYSPEETLRHLKTKQPIPSMHQPWYDEILKNIAYGQRHRVTVMDGPPGIGKTTLGQVMANATGMACHLIPCGYKVTSELIKETTVNGHKKNDIYAEINERFEDGKLSTLSTRTIKREFPDMIVDTPHGHRLDWDKITDEHLSRAQELMQDIAEAEGIISTQSHGAGITTKNGELLDILLHAINHQEPTIIILDEFSRRRGDGGAMQNLYEVLAGARDECTLEGGHGEKHTITNQDLREAGVYVLITSNPPTLDEPDVKDLPGALADRLAPISMSHPTAQDFQHAFERALVGFPISTEYLAQQEWWEAHPNEFGQHLLEEIEMGMTEEQKKRIPEYQRSLLANWGNVTQASQQIGEFFDRWRQVEDVDTRSINLANGTSVKKPDKVDMEVRRREDDRGHSAANTKVGVRLMTNNLLEEALIQLPEPISGSDAIKAHGFVADEYPEEHLGDRLVRELNLMIAYRYPDEKSEVRKYLKNQMGELGLLTAAEAAHITDQTTENDNTTDVRQSGGGRKSVAELLNTKRQLTISKEGRMMQELWADYLKEKYPDDIAPNAPADAILPINAVMGELAILPKQLQDKIAELGNTANSIPLVDAEFGEDKKGLTLTPTTLIDPRNYDGSGKGLPISAHEKIEAFLEERLNNGQAIAPSWKRFIMTLAKPGGAQALSPYLFTKAFTGLDADNEHSEAVKIAENRSDSKLAITSIDMGVTSNGDTNLVHVIKQDNELLIIGSEPIQDNLQTLLKQQNVTYIARSQQGAMEMVNEKLQRMTQEGDRWMQQQPQNALPHQSQDCMKLLHHAFRHRMEPVALVQEDKAENTQPRNSAPIKDMPLAKLLLDDRTLVQPALPVILLDIDVRDATATSKTARVIT